MNRRLFLGLSCIAVIPLMGMECAAVGVAIHEQEIEERRRRTGPMVLRDQEPPGGEGK